MGSLASIHTTELQEDRAYSRRGFTLLELIVAMSIFTMVLVISTGAVLGVLRANKHLQASQFAMNNLGLVLEHMVRTIRVGKTYHCNTGSGAIDSPQDCTSGASSFAFEKSGGDSSTIGDQIIYDLQAHPLGVGYEIRRSINGGSTYESFTSPEIVVEQMQFYVDNAQPPPADSEQPIVVLTIKGYSRTDPRVKSDFNIQSTISQRALDF